MIFLSACSGQQVCGYEIYRRFCLPSHVVMLALVFGALPRLAKREGAIVASGLAFGRELNLMT